MGRVQQLYPSAVNRAATKVIYTREDFHKQFFFSTDNFPYPTRTKRPMPRIGILQAESIESIDNVTLYFFFKYYLLLISQNNIPNYFTTIM